MIALHFAFPTTVGVIHGVHGHATNRRFLAAPTRAAGLAVGFVFVIEIANLADGRHAIQRKFANFPGRHLNQSEVAFFAEKLCRRACGANRLTSAAGIQLKVMDHGARRNVADLQCVARKDVRVFAGGNGGANFQAYRVQDVTLVAILIVKQSDVRAAIRVVLDGRNLGRHSRLVATEIDGAVLLLVTAPTVPDNDFTLVVAATRALFRFEQALLGRLLGDVALIEHRHKATRRGIWIKTLESHLYLYLPNLFAPGRPFPVIPNPLQILCVLDHLLAFGELDVSLLPIPPVAFV